MREIKFRGKRKDTGEWVYGYFTRNDESGRCYITTQSKTGGAHPWEVDPATVGQYTGKNDKNSREIYEGDIISAYNGRIKGPVIFDKRGLAFGVPNGPNEIYQFSMNFLESKDIKVIGNIYENPEILAVVETDVKE